MRDLNIYARICMFELDCLKIKYAKNLTLKVNTRAKTRLGVCKKSGDCYEIEIAAILLDERTPEEYLKNTLMHELLHTCYGCMKHTGRWKKLAEQVNAAYGYDVKRTDSPDEEILPEALAGKPKYKVVCPVCGTVYERYRKSALIQHPERYRCGRCKAKLG